jgi:hypothetical protein
MSAKLRRRRPTSLKRVAEDVHREVLAIDGARCTIERPTAALGTGAAGTAFYFVSHGLRTNDRASYACADVWSKRARAEAVDQPRAFDVEPNEELPLMHLATGVSSGMAGLGYVRTLLGVARGLPGEITRGVDEVVDAYELQRIHAPDATDIYTGMAGFIAATNAILPLVSHPRLRWMREDALERLIHRYRGREVACVTPSFGLSHGHAGELLALVRSRDVPSAPLWPLLDQISSSAVVEDELVAWPRATGEPVPGPLWASICNGVTGHLLLYAHAAARWGRPTDVRMAHRCAATVAALVQSDFTLCCGSAGQALALFEAGRLLADETMIARARRRALLAASRMTLGSSLLKGGLGVGWVCGVIRDRVSPIRALHPVF